MRFRDSFVKLISSPYSLAAQLQRGRSVLMHPKSCKFRGGGVILGLDSLYTRKPFSFFSRDFSPFWIFLKKFLYFVSNRLNSEVCLLHRA
ncbi:Hypothetical predicted protein [Podarcis lilfordi]|uniref:Uncharacterized protein n=1 Tax=Podarcis lilfordi TaxID=74358 RepID=A0AA35KJC7_9SAUR|nr:Hypothetical predicted protein [Podarcis lilfordi]